MNLTEGKKGEVYQVQSIQLKTAVKRRLQVLGLTDNSKVKIMNRKRSGSMIIQIRGTRFAIGARFASGIMIGGRTE